MSTDTLTAADLDIAPWTEAEWLAYEARCERNARPHCECGAFLKKTPDESFYSRSFDVPHSWSWFCKRCGNWYTEYEF